MKKHKSQELRCITWLGTISLIQSTIRWRSDQSVPAIFWNPWSHKSEWWPPEGDNPWFLLFSIRIVPSLNLHTNFSLKNESKFFLKPNRTKIDWLDWLLQKFLEMETLWHPLVSFKINYCCRQSPIIKNDPIRNNAEILGIFKEWMLSRSKLSNA